MGHYIDLHIHTNHSDGICSVEEILSMVRVKELAAFALADHDTLSGYCEMCRILTGDDPDLISGIELSAAAGDDDVHILGYMVDPDDSALNAEITRLQKERNQRGRRIVEKLKELGIDIPFEAVLETANNRVIGRPHIAETMHRLGATRSYQEGFDRYIGTGCPACVPKVRLKLNEAIDLVHGAGGVAVLAHPLADGSVKHLETLVELGLDGMEVWHYSVGPKDTRRLLRLAQRHNLLVSGGSDFHGRGEFDQGPGAQPIPADHLEKLKQRSLEIRGQD